MINSPLARVFRGHESKLPIAFEEQFLATPERTYDVVLEGVMHRIWNHPAWLKPLFVIFGRLGLLIPGTGENIPFRLEVIPGYLSDGQPVHEWKRTFEFG